MKSWKQKQLATVDDRPTRLRKLRDWFHRIRSNVAQKAGRIWHFGARSRISVEERLRASWPMIQKAVLENAVDLARTAAQNDVELRRLFEGVYRKLPPKMRRWVSKEQFVRFCFQNRDRLLKTPVALPDSPPINTRQIGS